MKLFTYSSLLTLLFHISCVNRTDVCSDHFIISKENYSVFLHHKEEFKSCGFISIMRIGNDSLSHILDNVKTSTFLKSLCISKIRSSSTSMSIHEFDSLSELEIIDCRLDTLFIEPRILNSLKKLNLSYNMLDTIPNEINKISNINLSHNNLVELPNKLLKSNHIEYLNIANNRIQSFPLDSVEWPNLKLLILANNPLDSNFIRSAKMKFSDSILVLKNFPLME